MGLQYLFTTVICSVFLQIQVNAEFNAAWTNFNVKISKAGVGQWKVPLTLQDAQKEGYVKSVDHEEFPKIGIHCLKNDPRACPMYDQNKRFCGFRIGYIINTLSGKCPISSNYYFDKIAIFKKGKAFATDYYYVDFIFADPASLKVGGPKTRKDPLGDQLFVKLDGKAWKEIPKKETDITTIPKIVKHACFPQMGQHYFFINEKTPCSEAFPFFVMYHEGKLVAIGMVSFGTVSSNTRDWYEDIPDWFTKMTFTKPPSCMIDSINKCGGIGMHMYLTDKPETITCPKP